MKAARAKTKQVVLIRVSLLKEKQHPTIRRSVFRKTREKNWHVLMWPST